MQLLIVADDLTGALDSAVKLAEVGLRCRVARRPADIAAALEDRPEVLAVSTASREGDADAARRAVDAVLDAIGPTTPTWFFKKVDSRLKGHVSVEAGTLATRAGATRALVAPAIPAQGRVVAGGMLSGAGIPVPVDVAAIVGGSGLEFDIPNVWQDADLDAALDTAMAGAPCLLIGAAALAAALARRLAPGRIPAAATDLAAPLLLAIGSRDPITIAQVDAVRAAGGIEMRSAPDGVLAEASAAISGPAVLVQLVPGGADLEPREAGGRFARSVASLVRGSAVGTLLACGGETADAILGELGVGVLAVKGEMLPGVPVSAMAVDGRAMQLVTKSGGFGGIDTLSSVLEAVGRGMRKEAR